MGATASAFSPLVGQFQCISLLGEGDQYFLFVCDFLLSDGCRQVLFAQYSHVVLFFVLYSISSLVLFFKVPELHELEKNWPNMFN